ncbi:uncharacterized protein LOC128220579 isoform X2 [Mya arenaria]|uniref:uncharacterized protein LOC128220579 isoform X2 n=1 Tax=Mya arenaria TaxID=6604 RepID=UPI0022E5A8C2|nr:uncharacterized protein LOC128220579 isoform X2 [Mya arenaria]
MNPLKCVIVTILYCFGEICKGQGVFVSQHETKWNESRCTLAEPSVTCKDYDSCIVENGLDFFTKADGQDNGFWIGYAKTWISYAYVGCGQLNDGTNYSVPTLGECRRTTGCQAFGIQKSIAGLRCKCASKVPKQKTSCGEKCDEPDQYPCGDTVDPNIFSFYTVENVPPSNNSKDIHNNCLQFSLKYRPGNDYHWESCTLDTYPKLLCSNKSYFDDKPKAKIYTRSDGNWAQAVENCIVGEKFPASIQSIRNANFTDPESQNHWTGIIKKESIISAGDMLDDSSYPPLTYAYVEKINRTVYVIFEGDSKTKRKSLCVGDGTSAGPTTTSQETQPTSSESTTAPPKGPTSGVTSTRKVITTDTQPTQTPVLNASATPTSHQVPEGTAAPLEKDEGGSTAGLAAGLSVSLVVIIIVTVIVMVFLKRRGLLTKCFKQNDEKSNHTEDTATEIACISTPIFEFTTNIVDDLTATNHSYFVLEKTFDEETKEETEHYAEPDMTDVDHYDLTDESQKDTENDYDTTNDKKSSVKAGLAKPNNSYNKVTLYQTSEYDHINRRPPKSDRQTENEYDISNNLIDGKPNNNLNENSDTYNHLNKHDLKNFGTDNVYGKSETDGYNGYATSSALTLRRNMDKNDQQADYDVINKKW